MSQKTPTTAPDMQAPRLYTAKISGIEEPSIDTRILRVLPTGEHKPAFKAGQYALLHAPALEPRAFSIASSPHEPELEFHVKNTGRGLSAWVFNAVTIGMEITLEAPFGTHYWRPLGKPLLALAGGVGVAPIKAIVETHLLEDAITPVWLYWGVKNARQLYLDSFFRRLSEQFPRFHYTPVLTDPPAEGSRLRTGTLSTALCVDFPSLAGSVAYMAGPTAMVDATLPTLLDKGVARAHIFSDAFGG